MAYPVPGGGHAVAQSPLVQPLRRWDPEQIGGYTLLGRLGAGAMGQVYLGRSAAGRMVAVKTIKSELAEEPDFRTRFGQEVAAARRVSGAFTAAVVAADSEADVPWLATVYVPAPSLSRLVRSCGPLPAAAVCWLAAGCAEALEAIHGVGLVHRDLKPSNVLVSPDGPRVIDFGVARAVERIQLTVTRGSIGTPAYMAPEQARDTRQATPASDVFSLGATILFAATGHAPYEGETVMDVLVRLATEPPDLAGLPAELTDLVESCLERDPRRRPSSASIVARLAPALDPGGDLGRAALPPEALRLIDEFRQAPATAAEPGPEPAGEWTLGSQPALAGADAGRVGPLVGLPAGLADAGRPGQSAGSGSNRASAHWWNGTRTTRARRAGLAVAAAGILIGAGWAIGSTVAGTGSPTLGPILQPPPGNGPPPGTTSHGAPNVALNQPYGDPETTFVVHGGNWPPGQRLTVTLVGVAVSPIHPIADRTGTFNYAINQDHEFVRGGLPPGVYTVKVTDSAGASAKASFEVQR
jgi:hypothetical protein